MISELFQARSAHVRLAILVFAVSMSPSVSAAELTSSDFASFVAPIIDTQLRSRHIAGAVVIAVKDGAVIHRGGYGMADVAEGRSMDAAHTVLRLGSISKLFTAVAVMQLVERGKLDLDRDIRDYIDFDIPVEWQAQPLTLRRLLSRQVPFEERIGGIASLSGERAGLRRFLQTHWPSVVNVPHGTAVYSNFAYSIAAYAVERASGEGFEEYLQRNIFEPLGMTSASALQPLPDAIGSRVARGYDRSDLPPNVLSDGAAIIHEIGSTAVCASAEDVTRFILALLGTHAADTTSMLTPASLTQMFSPQFGVANGVMGLGLYAPLAGAASFIGHEGDTGGFHGMLALRPEQRFGLFVLYNSNSAIDVSSSARAELLDRIANRYFPEGLRRSAATAGVRQPVLAGFYQPSRRNDSTFMSLMALLSQRYVTEPTGFITQMGAPFDVYVRVPWWKSVKVVVPAVAIAILVTVVRLAIWPFRVLRARFQRKRLLPGLDTFVRTAALFQLVAVVMAAWLLFPANLAVRLGEGYVVPFALLMFAFAWFGVLGVGGSAWRLARQWKHLGVWARCGTAVTSLAALVLALFCVIWRIAGVSLAF